MIVQRELLTEGSPQGEEGEEEKELDLGKTGKNLWNLITMSGPSAEYEAVLQFLDESIPKLKVKQQADMNQHLSTRLYHLSQRLVKTFLSTSLDPLRQPSSNIALTYTSCLQSLSTAYRRLREQVAYV